MVSAADAACVARRISADDGSALSGIPCSECGAVGTWFETHRAGTLSCNHTVYCDACNRRSQTRFWVAIGAFAAVIAWAAGLTSALGAIAYFVLLSLGCKIHELIVDELLDHDASAGITMAVYFLSKIAFMAALPLLGVCAAVLLIG